MRTTLSRLLVEAARADPKVIVLTGDHGYALFRDLRAKRPGQFLNCGIAEQNMIGVAAGLARQGFKPIVYALAAFMPCRTVEQIRLDLCYHNLPVVLLGDGAGLVYSNLGPSHHACEDVALLRSLPNITIYSPADRGDLADCFRGALKAPGPVYLRLGKSDLGDVDRTLGVWGAETAILATGSMVKTAQAAAAILGADVWRLNTLKPLPDGWPMRYLGVKLIVTLEEHSTMGGLGSIAAEYIAEHPGPRLLRLGVPDGFRKTAGSWGFLIKQCGLDVESVVARVRGAMS